MAANNMLVADYVYQAEQDGEFRNVRVEVKIGDDEAEIRLVPEIDISDGELIGVLLDIEHDILKKGRISLLNDCRVALFTAGETYIIALEGQPLRVVGKDRLLT